MLLGVRGLDLKGGCSNLGVTVEGDCPLQVGSSKGGSLP